MDARHGLKGLMAEKTATHIDVRKQTAQLSLTWHARPGKDSFVAQDKSTASSVVSSGRRGVGAHSAPLHETCSVLCCAAGPSIHVQACQAPKRKSRMPEAVAGAQAVRCGFKPIVACLAPLGQQFCWKASIA